MRTIRHIEIYLMEDVRVESGNLERQFVPHHFSVLQSIHVALDLIRSLNQILTLDESKDLKVDVLKALDAPGFDQGIEVVPNHLKVHEV